MAACGRSRGPYVAVVGDKLTTAQSKSERNDTEPAPAPAHPRWLESLSCYERREIREFQVSRYEPSRISSARVSDQNRTGSHPRCWSSSSKDAATVWWDGKWA
jgi:hypothetical protein